MYCRGFFMKHARQIGFILAAMLLVNSFAGAPAIAQQDEADALNKRAIELYQAGKFSEATPLAQRALAIREKALGPDHLNIAPTPECTRRAVPRHEVTRCLPSVIFDDMRQNGNLGEDANVHE
jgi:hypothetical protein